MTTSECNECRSVNGYHYPDCPAASPRLRFNQIKVPELTKFVLCVPPNTLMFSPTGEIFLNDRLIETDKKLVVSFRKLISGFDGSNSELHLLRSLAEKLRKVDYFSRDEFIFNPKEEKLLDEAFIILNKWKNFNCPDVAAETVWVLDDPG